MLKVRHTRTKYDIELPQTSNHCYGFGPCTCATTTTLLYFFGCTGGMQTVGRGLVPRRDNAGNAGNAAGHKAPPYSDLERGDANASATT